VKLSSLSAVVDQKQNTSVETHRGTFSNQDDHIPRGKLLYQKNFINLVVDLIDFCDIGIQVNFDKMKLTSKLGCLTIDFSQARGG